MIYIKTFICTAIYAFLCVFLLAQIQSCNYKQPEEQTTIPEVPVEVPIADGTEVGQDNKHVKIKKTKRIKSKPLKIIHPKKPLQVQPTYIEVESEVLKLQNKIAEITTSLTECRIEVENLKKENGTSSLLLKIKDKTIQEALQLVHIQQDTINTQNEIIQEMKDGFQKKNTTKSLR